VTIIPKIVYPNLVTSVKVEKKKKDGYLLELIIKIQRFEKEKENLLNLANLGHFFPWKILCIGQNHTFQVKFCKNSPVEETLVSTYPPWLCNYMKTRTCNIWDSLIRCTFKFCNIKKFLVGIECAQCVHIFKMLILLCPWPQVFQWAVFYSHNQMERKKKMWIHVLIAHRPSSSYDQFMTLKI